MLNLSRDWRWWIGGTEVTAAVEAWELNREQPDLDTPAYWRGRVVLVRPVGSPLVLDPLSNSQWRQGSEARLEIDGTRVFTGQVVLAYYNDWAAVPRLELEVGDLLFVNHRRRVIPLAVHSPQTLLGLAGAPTSPTVEITTDLDSPVRLAQQLTWVTAPPRTLYTLPDGTVGVTQPEVAPSFSRQVTEVLDASRVRPALEIPGTVVASANIRVELPTAPENTAPEQQERVLVEGTPEQRIITILDGLGRPIRKETQNREENQWYTVSLSTWKYSADEKGSYEVIRDTWVRINDVLRFWEQEIEKAKIQSSYWEGAPPQLRGILNWSISVDVLRTKQIFWREWRLGFSSDWDVLVYQETESYFQVPPSGEGHVYRSVSRARGTIEEGLSYGEAIKMVTVTSEVKPANYLPPAWARPAAQSDDQPAARPTAVVPVSATAEVVGGNGPPLYVSLPWLTEPTTAQRALEQHARWLATEIAGRAYARRIAMPVPNEWLSNPRPWRMLRFETTPPEALWLVGERLSADKTGIRFEALGVLASPPGQIPAGDGIPSLLSFVQRGQPTIGVAVVGGTVETVALDASVGSGAEGSVVLSETAKAVGIGVDADPGAVAVGHGAEGTSEITGGGGGAEGNYLILQAEEAHYVYGSFVDDNAASGCQAAVLGVDRFVRWENLGFSGSGTVWLRLRYRGDDANVAITYGPTGDLWAGVFSVSASGSYTTYDYVLNTETVDVLEIDITSVSGSFYLDAVMLVDQATLDASGWPEFPPCNP